MKTTACDTRLFIWNNGVTPIPEQTHGAGFNVGQHVSMNRLIDEASKLGADYFVRVDEDCVFETPDWLAKMLRIQRTHIKRYGIPCVLGPFVHGLNNQIQRISLDDIYIGKFQCHLVGILGGICRMMPMAVLRYWRFDERMPLGYSEADNFARFCAARRVPMLRTTGIEVNHGGSTDEQIKADPNWAYEHLMLQYMPYGL